MEGIGSGGVRGYGDWVGGGQESRGRVLPRSNGGKLTSFYTQVEEGGLLARS